MVEVNEIEVIEAIKSDIRLALSAIADYRDNPALGFEVIRSLLKGALKR
jgi:hypothetical protein